MDYEFVPGRDDFPPDEIAMLRRQLASAAKERDEIAAQARMLDRMVDERDDQLAAALAACEVKDAALESLISHTLSCEHRLDEFHGLGNDSGSGCSIELCNASSALTIKPDASALKAHDEALIERCAEVCEEHQGGAETCAAAIRELKSQL